MAAGLSLASVSFAQSSPASLPELTSQIEQTANQLKPAEEQLKFVETQYSQRPEPTDEQAVLRHFSEGEIQYLLGDYAGASVLFYDLIEDKSFKASPHYPDALFYLADALYQQKNYLGARLYLREFLPLNSQHYRLALIRYLDIAGRLNDFTGIDEYVARARGPSGELAPDLAYVYGKWFFKRTDLPREERLRRASEVFKPLADNPQGTFRLQSAYFLGVADVQTGNFAAAAERFRAIAQDKAQGEREAKLKELAILSEGRVLYEMGKYDETLARYAELAPESEYFAESLYEIAWTQVKKGQFDRARNAVDLLLLVSPESTLAPDAQLLQAHLLLKLHRYGEATDTYGKVINSYAPVRDELDALLSVNKDPVAYFDNLLARNERHLDVNSLLPAVAVKWATTQKEVADAVRMVNDLELGRQGLGESEDIAKRILKALDEREMETFPTLQEGYTRADTVDSAITRADETLVRIEGSLVQDALTPETRAELQQYRAQAADLAKRFRSLPATEKELLERKHQLRERVDQLDREAFKLGSEVQSMYASVAAIMKWLDDTRAERKRQPEEEKAFGERLKEQVSVLSALRKQLDQLRGQISDQRAAAEATMAGDDATRSRYQEALNREHAIISAAEANLPPEPAKLIQRAHEIRTRTVALRERVAAAKTVLRDQVSRRGKRIRDKLAAIQTILSGYGGEVGTVSGNARNLVGRIAFDSFQRVRHQFYELVLKADVGLVDVAFTRKQDKTVEIQKVSLEKERDLRALDDEFKEVLKDVD
jgi:TolA-binding protein